MALYGPELLELATENQCDLFYEASVAGGIPILRGLVDGLSSDRITKMMGIVNGTTNFILTKMSKEGRAYEDVLKEAQELGFAEVRSNRGCRWTGCRTENGDSIDSWFFNEYWLA